MSTTRQHPLGVSVVIAVERSDYDVLGRQLERLDGQRGTVDSFEIVLGDNDGGLGVGFGDWSWVRVVDASHRRGAAFARNRAAAVAAEEFLLFCDADDLVAPNWVRRHVEVLAEHGFTAGALRAVDALDPIVENILTGGSWPTEGFDTRGLFHEGIAIASSANMGIRRSMFGQVGGFPEEYLRSQDVALSLALRRTGILPRFVPDAQVLYVTGRRTPAQRRQLRRAIGASRAKLHVDFGVGPGPAGLIARATARTLRAMIHPLAPQVARRPMGDEAAELVGIVRFTTSRAVSHSRRTGA